MKLSEMVINQKVIVQIIWGGKTLEFPFVVLGRVEDGVSIMPYEHDGRLLEFNIDYNSGVLCNIYTDDINNQSRVSWKNVTVTTETRDRGVMYIIKTSVFNQMSKNDERRLNDRMVIRKNGQIINDNNEKPVDIMVHDISDAGLSFYAPTGYMPRSNQVKIVFGDSIDGKEYNIKIDCTIARTENKLGTVFYGCKIMGDNRDYLVYGFMKRLSKKSHKEE